jgi:CRP/FNR family transcriptional regulator, nitrogen fixation regulation protein
MAPTLSSSSERPELFGCRLPPASPSRIRRNGTIFRQGEPATGFYLLASGCARAARLTRDGRRQIDSFFFSGDFLGWESVGLHEFAAEAVTSCVLYWYPRDTLDDLFPLAGPFGSFLLRNAAARARSSRDHITLLGRAHAAERVLGFLREMASQFGTPGNVRIEVPVSRNDMSDYLGLTVGTVCRQLAALKRRGVIAIESAKVILPDRETLDQAVAAPATRNASGRPRKNPEVSRPAHPQSHLN